MQVTHISYSTMGGAGRVAQTLVEAQKALGWDAELITVTDSNLWEHPLRNPLITAAAAIDNFVLSNRSKPTPISLLRSKQSALGHLLPELKKKKNLHLHWMEGVLTVDEIAELARGGVNIVWTAHDMAPFTAVCHHSFDCQQLRNSCRGCPQVRKFAQMLVLNEFEKKNHSKELIEQFKFVFPSKWLYGYAIESAVVQANLSFVIHNPIDDIFFETIKKSSNLQKRPIFISLANDLSDPNKNMQRLLDIFETSLRGKANLMLVGRNGHKLNVRSNSVQIIEASGPIAVRDSLDKADAIISLSSAESFSLAVAEGIVRGLYVFVPKNSASEELLTFGLGEHFDGITDLEKRLLRYITTKGIQAASLKASALDSLRVENVVKEYETLYVP